MSAVIPEWPDNRLPDSCDKHGGGYDWREVLRANGARVDPRNDIGLGILYDTPDRIRSKPEDSSLEDY